MAGHRYDGSFLAVFKRKMTEAKGKEEKNDRK